MGFRYKNFRNHHEWQLYIGELLDSIHHSLLEIKEEMRDEYLKKLEQQ